MFIINIKYYLTLSLFFVFGAMLQATDTSDLRSFPSSIEDEVLNQLKQRVLDLGKELTQANRKIAIELFDKFVEEAVFELQCEDLHKKTDYKVLTFFDFTRAVVNKMADKGISKYIILRYLETIRKTLENLNPDSLSSNSYYCVIL